MFKFAVIAPVLTLAALALSSTAAAQPDDGTSWSIAIHGGAGTIERDRITPEKDTEIRAALNKALAEGSKILKAGGSAMDAITSTITLLENDPNFNAGKARFSRGIKPTSWIAV